MNTKKIYFVRHGETQSNVERYVPSKLEPLNLNGFAQAEQMALRIQELDIHKLYISDFLRAQQTAEPIALATGLTPIVNPAFGEILEASSLFGVSEEDERVQGPRTIRNTNIEDQNWRYEDAENFSDVFARIMQAKTLLQEDESETLLVVSHSFYMSCFTSAMLLNAQAPSLSWYDIACKLQISNTGITLFEYSQEKGWKLIMWNDHAHFAE